jgi:hypothetical protein
MTRLEILRDLASRAESPVTRAQVSALALSAPSSGERDVALRLVDELLDPANASLVELFTRVLVWVYWKLSGEADLMDGDRFLVSWAHSSRLVDLFVGAGLDVTALSEVFLAQGQIFPDDFWTRASTSLDVLHPLASDGARLVCACAAYVARLARTSADAEVVARALSKSIFPSGPKLPIPLMRDLSLATNVTGSFLAAEIANVVQRADPGAAELLSRETKRAVLVETMVEIEKGTATSAMWRAIGAIVGISEPPEEVRSLLRDFVGGAAIENVVTSAVALDAFAVLSDMHTHLGVDCRQRIEDLAIASLSRWQERRLEPVTMQREAQRWIGIAIALAARPASQEETGSALGRLLQRFIDAAPAVAPAVHQLLTMLPTQLPMAYLPALWPAVIAARAAAPSNAH